MTAQVFLLPFVSRPAAEQVADELQEAGYTHEEKFSVKAGGKYNPPLNVWRVWKE